MKSTMEATNECRLFMLAVIIISSVTPLPSTKRLHSFAHIHFMQTQPFSQNRIEIREIKSKALLFGLLIFPQASYGATIKQDINKVAAAIPGFGPPDIYYPKVWEGIWKVNQTVSDVIVEDNPNNKYLPQSQEFKSLIHLHSYEFDRAYSLQDGNVVIDRAITSTNFFRSVLGQASNTLGRWDWRNPNILQVQTPYGLATNFKVTKRSVETPPAPPSTTESIIFGYSEFSQVAVSADGDGEDSSEMEQKLRALFKLSPVPKVFAYRILTRYRVESGGASIQGLERLYVYGDNTLDLNEQPLITIKSSVRMTRKI